MQNDTIVALATGADAAALAVIRLSGPLTGDIVRGLCPKKDWHVLGSHTLHYAQIYDGAELLDEAVISVFKAPQSFTKEDVAEISVHGSSYVVKRVLETCLRLGARPAEPGEFTLRAYLNGRFDLSQAEAVADLIASDNAGAHRLALEQLRGGFSQLIKTLREKLIHFASMLELELDFSQEDVEFVDRAQMRALLEEIMLVVSDLLESFRQGNALKEGVPVAIVGPPNVGKSTLLNALLNEEKAIVTAIPGTTRDVIEDYLFVDGIKFRILDTAGIRETSDVVESMGIERSRKAINEAHILVLMYEHEAQKTEIETLAQIARHQATQVIYVHNKTDVNPHAATIFTHEIRMAAAQGAGLEMLRKTLVQLSGAGTSGRVIVTNLRHVKHLHEAKNALTEALEGLNENIPTDILAQQIRQALHHLGLLTGSISTDDLLGNIFSKFCIGK